MEIKRKIFYVRMFIYIFHVWFEYGKSNWFQWRIDYYFSNFSLLFYVVVIVITAATIVVAVSMKVTKLRANRSALKNFIKIAIIWFHHRVEYIDIYSNKPWILMLCTMSAEVGYYIYKSCTHNTPFLSPLFFIIILWKLNPIFQEKFTQFTIVEYKFI